MAKIFVMGDAVIIASAIKAEDLSLIAKYRPKALGLTDEDGNVIFKIGLTDGAGSVNKFGISFGGVARDGSGSATVTLPFSGSTDPEKVKSEVADEYGTAIANLNAIEAGLPAVLAEIAEAKAAVVAAIEVG